MKLGLEDLDVKRISSLEADQFPVQPYNDYSLGQYLNCSLVRGPEPEDTDKPGPDSRPIETVR